jgi:hypothetical protein
MGLKILVLLMGDILCLAAKSRKRAAKQVGGAFSAL